MSTEMKNVIDVEGTNAQYDECAKRILGQKSTDYYINVEAQKNRADRL